MMVSESLSAPAAVADAPRTSLDVRPVLEAGGEPFGQIMSAAAAVPTGHVFCLRATFKPVPLFGVMHLRGWSYWIESGSGNDWTICFYRHGDFGG